MYMCVRGFRLIAVLFSVVLVAAGCGTVKGAGDVSASEFHVGVVGCDMSNISPAKGSALEVNSYVNEFLMKLSPTGEVLPNLAESVDQINDITYVYTLRDDVKFSNGEDLTAHDVVVSLDYLRDPEFPESWRYQAIDDVTAEDAHNVVITLSAPTASFQYVLAMNGYIFNADHQISSGDNFGKPGTGIIGTGPYVIEDIDATNGVTTFVANDNYWGRHPVMNKVTLTSFSDQNIEALAFRAGEIDLAFPDDVRAFKSTAGTDISSVPGTRLGLFIMNNTVKPWADVHVRRAVAYAINKDDIINVMGGAAKPVTTLIPPVQLLTVASQDEVNKLIDSLPSYEFDIEKAKAEMAKSAYPNGFTAKMVTASLGGFAETSQAISGQLKDIGIDLDVAVQSESEYATIYSLPHSETPVWYTYFTNNTPDPGGMPRLALDSAATAIGMNNFADFVNPTVDQLIKKADATNNLSERFDVYSEILSVIADEVPYIPLYVGDNNMVISDDFRWPEFNSFSTGHTPFVTQIIAN